MTSFYDTWEMVEDRGKIVHEKDRKFVSAFINKKKHPLY